MQALTPSRRASASQVGKFRRLVALVALLFVAPGCFLFGRPPAREPVGSETEIALSVTNHSTLDVVIFVVHDGQRTQVGTVTAASSTVLVIPVRLLSQGREIRLLGDPVGGRDRAQTGSIIVQPGQRIEWTLEADLRRSSVAVY